MEIIYRTRRCAQAEAAKFWEYLQVRLAPDFVHTKHAHSRKMSIRRNTDDFTWGGRGVTYSLVICDSLKLSAQDFFGSDSYRIWRCC